MVKEADRGSLREVRHLAVHSFQDLNVAVLTRLVSGVQSDIGTGKLYEMVKWADSVTHEWAREGFRYQRNPVYEDLKSAVTLAMLMGYEVIYDPECVDVGTTNLTGAVPLTQWPGRSGKNGGGYEYAFTGTKMVASPTLAPGLGINMATHQEELAQTMCQAIDLLNSVGPVVELVLG